VVVVLSKMLESFKVDMSIVLVFLVQMIEVVMFVGVIA
jgi:hypothetical protein